MSDGHLSRSELARQVVVGLATGLAAGYAGPAAGAAAAGAAPLVLAGMEYISATIDSRRLEHATETLTDAADEFGARTPMEFVEFIKAAVSDQEHQELLARALTIAQDTAMRDKRRALGRAVASAASDTGTNVGEELLFIRALTDLDAPHVAVLKTISLEPPNRRPLPTMWLYNDILERLPILANTLQAILATLELHTLISKVQFTAESGRPGVESYRIEHSGRLLLMRLAEDPD